MSTDDVEVRLEQEQGCRFRATFAGGAPALVCDEPPPLGQSAGPSPIELLAAAVGTCLSDSLLFALRKYKQSAEPLSCTVTARMGRNLEGRLRVQGMHAELRLGVPAHSIEHLQRALSQFEAFCTVKQSIGGCIPVEVTVSDVSGACLRRTAGPGTASAPAHQHDPFEVP